MMFRGQKVLNGGSVNCAASGLVVGGAVLFDEELAALAGAVRVAGEGEHFGVMHEAIDLAAATTFIGKLFAPTAERRFEVNIIKPCS